MAKQIEDIQAKLNWHWRDSMRTIRFFSFDSRVAILVPVWLIYLRWSTIIITFLVFYVFKFLENKGLTFPSALRALRCYLLGNYRPSMIGVASHKFIDYG